MRVLVGIVDNRTAALGRNGVVAGRCLVHFAVVNAS